jgi:hypothetical protein
MAMGTSRWRIVLAAVWLAVAAPAWGQDDGDYAYDAPAASPRAAAAGGLLRSSTLVDSPTATVLGHGHYRIECRLMHGGSLVAGTGVGIKDRLEVGVSWGMQGLLGRGEVEFNDRTALSLRLLLAEEMELPAIAIGFDNQGYGAWDEDRERYERKSKGFFLTLTRNWYGPLGTDVATTGGINYSGEDRDESSLDFFAGLEQDFDGRVALLVDYAAGLDDRRDETPARYGSGRGWLDVGLRWNVVDQVQFKFFFRDLLANYRDPFDGSRESVDRQLEISYEGSF